MRGLAAPLLLTALAGCVPTTKYAYAPVTRENFDAAQNGKAIPLVAQSTALCFADGRTALLRDATWTDAGICGQAHAPVGEDDGQACYARGTLAGIGIPYEGRSASVVPMAAFKLGKCDPEALTQ